MDKIYSGDEKEYERMSTQMLADIRYGSQSHLSVNTGEACYKICDRIKHRQSEWKGALKAT